MSILFVGLVCVYYDSVVITYLTFESELRHAGNISSIIVGIWPTANMILPRALL